MHKRSDYINTDTPLKSDLLNYFSKNEKLIVLETKVGLQTITKEEIYDVKVKKFSFLKSLGLIIVTPYGLIFLFLALGGGM